MTPQNYEVTRGYKEVVTAHQAKIRRSSAAAHGAGPVRPAERSGVRTPVATYHAGRVVEQGPDSTAWPLLICVLGTFRVLQAGQPVPVHGGKTEALLCHLALHYAEGV